jgi:hypothetical protein
MNNAIESEIRGLEERLKQAESPTNPDLFDELLVDGFTFTGQDGVIYTKEQVLAAHRPAGAKKFTRVGTSDLQIRALESAAVVTVRTDYATESMRFALLFTRFWLKRNGRWQIIGGSAVELEHSH